MRIGAAMGMGLMLVVLVGCGRGASIAKVSGKVTVGGQPVTGAMINFVSSETGVAASGSLDAKGGYDIPTGLKPGVYRVFVVPSSSPDRPPMPGQPPPAAAQSNVPLKYRSDATSRLSADLKLGDNPNVNFALD